MPSRLPFPAVPRRLPLLLLLALAAIAPARAQRLAAGTLRGEVLDAESAAPLAGATVALTPASQTAAMPPRERSAFLSAARTTTTGADGRYVFGDLAPGAYVLRVHRMGYRAATVEVSLAAPSEARVSVGLTMAPVLLQATEVRTRPVASSDTADARRTRTLEDARLAAARARQATYTSTDARELTRADVEEAVTLGESDLLRAFQRLPGVTTRDDYSSELWVRGARWDMTRVTFDGIPLFAPFHSSGSFSALPVDALAGAVLLPGARSASSGDAAAAVVELGSRAGGGTGAVRGTGDLSLVGAGLTLDQRRRDGKAAWMLSARRSYWDLFGGPNYEPSWLPLSDAYHYGDVVGRLDLALGGDRRLELSGLGSVDAYALAQSTTRWYDVAWPRSANRAGRMTLFTGLAGVPTRHDVTFSEAVGRARSIHIFDCVAVSCTPWPSVLPASSAMRHVGISGELAPAPQSSSWRAGYALAVERSSFDGFQYITVYRDTTGLRESSRTSLAVASLWGEHHWRVTPSVTMLTGLRLDAGAPLANAGALRPMPRVQLRWAADSQTSLSLGVARSWQYAQAFGRSDPTSGDRSETMNDYLTRWLLAGSDTPGLRSDIVTLGTERWIGAGVLAGANVYARRSAGVIVGNRRPGFTTERLELVSGQEHAEGIELSARKLTGRLTGSVGYTLAHAATRASDLTFPSSQDRPTALDATAMWRAWRGLRLGAAYGRFAGAPYTRRDMGRFTYDSLYKITGIEVPPSQQAPNARRSDAYESLDVVAQWETSLRAVRLTPWLQFRNVAQRVNPEAYTGSHTASCDMYGDGALPCRDGDLFGAGMGASFLAGVRFRF